MAKGLEMRSLEDGVLHRNRNHSEALCSAQVSRNMLVFGFTICDQTEDIWGCAGARPVKVVRPGKGTVSELLDDMVGVCSLTLPVLPEDH